MSKLDEAAIIGAAIAQARAEGRAEAIEAERREWCGAIDFLSGFPHYGGAKFRKLIEWNDQRRVKPAEEQFPATPNFAPDDSLRRDAELGANVRTVFAREKNGGFWIKPALLGDDEIHVIAASGFFKGATLDDAVAQAAKAAGGST